MDYKQFFDEVRSIVKRRGACLCGHNESCSVCNEDPQLTEVRALVIKATQGPGETYIREEDPLNEATATAGELWMEEP